MSYRAIHIKGKFVIYLFYQPPHPKLYDALCSVMGGLISPNVADNVNDMILPPYHSEWIGRSGSLSRASPQISVLPIGCTSTSNLKWQEDIPGMGSVLLGKDFTLGIINALTMRVRTHIKQRNKPLKLVFFNLALGGVISDYAEVCNHG